MNQDRLDPARLLADARVLVDQARVSGALDRLAQDLRTTLSGQHDWLLMPVLKGGMWAAMQLAQRLDTPLQMDYVHASRYRGETTGSELQWIARPRTDLEGRSVLLVDDIFDAGLTLQQIRAWLEGQGAAVVTAALVSKQHDRGLPRDWLDHAALDVPDQYIFGCGMDIYEYWRQLPEIYVYQPDGA